MKSVFPFALLLLLLTSCYENSLHCQKFLTGTYEYQAYKDGELVHWKVVRNDSLEIDYSNPNKPDTAKIRWINDCEYIATKYRPESWTDQQSWDLKIIKTTEDGYTFEFSLVGKQKAVQITAKRMD